MSTNPSGNTSSGVRVKPIDSYMACAAFIRSVVFRVSTVLPARRDSSTQASLSSPPAPRQPRVGLARSERLGLVRPAAPVGPVVELERHGPEAPAVLDGDQDRGPLGAVGDVGEPDEVFVPAPPGRSDELAVGVGGDAA